jgi:hypothetical protein
MTWSPRNRPGDDDDDDDIGAPISGDRPLSGMSDVSNDDLSTGANTGITHMQCKWCVRYGNVIHIYSGRTPATQ